MNTFYSHYIFFLFFVSLSCFAQNPVRQKQLIDKEWRFSFGHLYDTQKDFNHAESYFSYLAKAGNGDGPANSNFDDRSWRILDLPHDWAVEQEFSEKSSFSHGFKASGKGFPERSIGWYRKKINIPNSDLGKIISLHFDGVYRNSKVWFNGHYLGTNESGYDGFEYDISAYINYGGENTISVRVDASMEEGWYYEGAGIYRHVYLNKTNPIHIISNGTFVTSEINSDIATISAVVTFANKGNYLGSLTLKQTIFDSSGIEVAGSVQEVSATQPHKSSEVLSKLFIKNPKLWDIDSPSLYKLVTEISQNNTVVDQYETNFGIRSILFDAEKGFFLNGRHLKLKGTNNHQDHAGVGTALPDELHYFRIKKLKEMGANAYRCSHHPPTPELLDACDKLGMLVIDETRLMGINEVHLGQLKRMIERDRNHPSVFCWSLGNEEWKIEGNITGERITKTMQDFAKSIDPTRPSTVGISSGFKSGISSMVEIMGYNYLGNGDIDTHRNEFKSQPGMATEEGSTFATRGIYFTDESKQYKSAYDKKPRPSFYSIEEAWKFYATRPYMAGMFIWTGFDYRGEPTPYGWPSVASYFGMMDVCGFPKDNVYYLKSWWKEEPILHLFPHWNWKGMEGKEIDVWVYSNCDEVELFLNKRSLGKKKMEQYGHLEWKVMYQPGLIEAIGYKNGKKVMNSVRSTTGKAKNIKMTPDKNSIEKNSGIAVVTVELTDSNKQHIPIANNEIQFEIKGGGKIIGVGNGNPTSLEKDKFIDEYKDIQITDFVEQELTSTDLELQIDKYPNEKWKTAFEKRDYANLAKAYVYKGNFALNDSQLKGKITFLYQKIGVNAKIYINGKRAIPSSEDSNKFELNSDALQQQNTIHIVAIPIKKVNSWDEINSNPGVIQSIIPSEKWKRKLFNGYAQIIVQTDGSDQGIILSASTENLKKETLVLQKN